MLRQPRHPVLVTLWVLAWIGVVVAMLQPQIWAVEFLAAPIFALGTLAATTTPPDLDVHLRRGWRPVYFGILGGLAACGLAGIVASAGAIADAKFANAPLALLFLLAFVTAWRAIARPTPRCASLPAAVVLVSWVPLVVIDFLFDSNIEMAEWRDTLALIAGIGILALGALASLVSLLAFAYTERTDDLPVATSR